MRPATDYKCHECQPSHPFKFVIRGPNSQTYYGHVYDDMNTIIVTESIERPEFTAHEPLADDTTALLADDTTALLADDTTALLAEGGYAFDDDYLPMSELVEDEALVSPLILLERMLQGLSNLSREIVIDALLKRITHKTYQRYRMAQIRDVSQPDLPSLKIIRQLRSKVVRTHRLCQYQCPRSRFDRDESSITRCESFRWMSPLSSIPQYLMKLDTFEHFSPHLSVPTISDGPI
ncbi:hypothetical protein ADUPG1_012227, partial [Aduncisulcus paluster]